MDYDAAPKPQDEGFIELREPSVAYMPVGAGVGIGGFGEVDEALGWPSGLDVWADSGAIRRELDKLPEVESKVKREAGALREQC